MPRFKAVNKLGLLLPIREEDLHKVRKLEITPPDFQDLPMIQERTDKKYTGHLEVHDTVILMVELAGFQDFYEISCLPAISDKEDLDILTGEGMGNN